MNSVTFYAINIILAAMVTFDIFGFIKTLRIFRNQYTLIQEMLPAKTHDQNIDNTLDLLRLLVATFAIGLVLGALCMAIILVFVIYKWGI